MKISFGSGHDHASLVSSPALNAAGDAPCPSLRSGDEDSSGMFAGMGLWPSQIAATTSQFRNHISPCYSAHMDRCISLQAAVSRAHHAFRVACVVKHALCRLRYPVTCCSNVRCSISCASVGTYRSRHFSRWYIRLRRHPPAGGCWCARHLRYNNELSLVTVH